MGAVTQTPITDEYKNLGHRQRVLRGMQTSTFKENFFGEFEHLRRVIKLRDWSEVERTIKSLESCAVNVCEQFDETWERWKQATGGNA